MTDGIYTIVDIGGSKVLYILIDKTGQILFREKTSTPYNPDPLLLVSVIKDLTIEALKTRAGMKLSNIKKIGICSTGFLDHHSGVVYKAENLNWHQPVELCRLVSDSLSTTTIIENDGNAAVLGEVYFGAAKGEKDVIYVTISTGIGGGLFLNGHLYRGNKGFSGEIGHMKPFGKGRQCACGGYDCLESWASGKAIAQSASLKWKLLELEKETITTADVFKKAEEGNACAKDIIDDAALKIGLGLSNIAALLNPSCIVVGGGLASAQPEFLNHVISVTMEQAPTPATKITSLRIIPSILEPEAGIWGMFALLTGLAE